MNFISVGDLSKEEISRIFNIADDLKHERVEIALKEDDVLHLYLKNLLQEQGYRSRLQWHNLAGIQSI